MALSYLSIPLIFLVMIVAHIVSRFVPVLLVYTTPYIREDALSKAKPIGNQTTKTSVTIALITALIPLLFLDWLLIVGVALASIVVLWLFRAYIMKRTGGYSGDVLGALQQLVEVAIYLVVVGIQFS
jgi:adenosylcobinamide-GDP ribazoletransferase